MSHLPQATLVLLAAVSGCAYDFDAPFGGVAADAGADVVRTDRADVVYDVAPDEAQVDVLAESRDDVPADKPDDVPAEANCGMGTKACDGACVPLDNPATGCSATDCAPCAFAHGAALCINGACALGVCENSYGNCDGDGPNGCEADLTSDSSHCGTCGLACTYGNGQGACEGGACKFVSCNVDYVDCNNSVQSDGCETYVDSDDNNCGYCGHVCPDGFNCNNNACRCSSSAQCDTGGGGECNSYYLLCECSPYNYCEGPCTPTGACGG